MANATITVLEADGTTETDVVVLDVGRQAAAASKSVAMATEDKTVLDSLDTKLSTIDGHVDGLETLVAATNTALTTIDGRVDGLETLVTSTNTKLDTLHADTLTTVAHDAAGTGLNPVLMGGYASAAAPSDVSADGDAVREWRLRNGAAATVITAAGALVGGDATNGLKVQSPKGLANKIFVTTFATLTRPANTTPYTAADSISDNATAGSVTALVSGNISDVNDDPIFISEIKVDSTDTGLAGKKIRAYLFNADPTASSGVSGGDNAAYSQKKAGYIGSFMGYMETGFSDGSVGRLVPCYNETNFTQAGGFIPALPVSGARTLYIQYQAVEAFTPSANSTTIIGTAKGWQGRAV